MPAALTPVKAFDAIQQILDQTDTFSWTVHARQRAIERRFTADDVIRVLRTGIVSAAAEWDDRFQDWKYTVSGTDCDGEPLALVIAIEIRWLRITLITGMDTRE